MGLLIWLRTLLHTWRQRLWYLPERDMPPLPPVPVPVSVINMPSAPAPAPAKAVEPAVSKRVLEFRGFPWIEDGVEPRGTVRFTREIAVNGRAVKSELTVHEADLRQRPDGRFTLHERA